MAMPHEITPISSIEATERCPDCHSPYIDRLGSPQSSKASMNGAALYILIERCKICSWERGIPNVKLGA